MNGEEITLRKHIVNIKDFAEIINDLDSIFQRKLTLFDESFRSVNANRDSFAVVSRTLSKSFNIFEIANCIGEEL
jgi:hypothetical protein